MLALRNLTRRKIRSGLTVLGVAIGIAAVVALLAVARGIRAQFNSFFATGDAHLVLTRAGAADPFISYLPDALLDKLRAFDGVASVHPFLFAVKQVPRQPFFFLFGTTAGSPLLEHLAIVDGNGPFDPAPAAGDPPAICVGRRLATFLDLHTGDPLLLGNDRFRISGIFESSVPLLESGGVADFTVAQRAAGLEGKMSQALVNLTDFHPASVAARAAAIEAAFPDVSAATPAQFTHAFDEFDLMDQAVAVFTALAVLVGGIGVMNTMLMSVFERTREIGVLRAVGWSKAMILRSVLVEGLLVCAVAAPVGIGLGVVTVEVIASIGELGFIAGEYRAAVFAAAVGVAVGMGLVGAIYPAWRAVRITPIEALRYE